MASTTVLARGWTLTLGGTPIHGLETLTFSEVLKEADTTTREDAGQDSHLPASRKRSLTLKGKYLEDATGTRDAGQAAVETLAAAVGAAGLGTFVLSSPSTPSHTRTFQGSAEVTSLGGSNDEASVWEAKIGVSGAIT